MTDILEPSMAELERFVRDTLNPGDEHQFVIQNYQEVVIAYIEQRGPVV